MKRIVSIPPWSWSIASPDLGAAQGSMDQSVNSSDDSRVLSQVLVLGKLMKPPKCSSDTGLPVVNSSVLQLIVWENPCAKLRDAWGKGGFEGCALQSRSCTQWMNLLCRVERNVEDSVEASSVHPNTHPTHMKDHARVELLPMQIFSESYPRTAGGSMGYECVNVWSTNIL